MDVTVKEVDKLINIFTKTLEKAARKITTIYQEPYCEISQDIKKLSLKVVLPKVVKKNISLRFIDNLLEIEAIKEGGKRQSRFGYAKRIKFFKSITLPPICDTKHAKISYAGELLQVILPFKKRS